ncbi:hypothetical protein ACQ33O_13020 [Ferruginibacter sp. SUN002]|uniref:hypothetical protein n=1 Tax=Ferruginibacter sp. SUN002 TaxID=2937789 RepID=UPI003D35B31C
MPQRNIIPFTQDRFKEILLFFYRSRFFIALISALLLLLCSCNKSADDYTITDFQKYFEANILNKDFVVYYASDNGTELTSNYIGYTFVLTKTTSYFDGPITGTKGSDVYTGTWSSNEDYSKLTINLTDPSIPTEFIFLNRPWKFTDKTFPVLELAPWGTSEPKVLKMQRL